MCVCMCITIRVSAVLVNSDLQDRECPPLGRYSYNKGLSSPIISARSDSRLFLLISAAFRLATDEIVPPPAPPPASSNSLVPRKLGSVARGSSCLRKKSRRSPRLSELLGSVTSAPE